ncbi:MAG: TlpA family protein disulfide reductase [Dehalococcoidia bacterium]|nr:TlpA family protein disulfide reductase [Dehalococcoidia bacterium]
MATLCSFWGLSSISPTRRIWLRRGTAALILIAAVVAFVSQECASGGDATAQRLGIIEGVASPAVGQRAPDFVLEEYETGRLVRLSDFRGKTVVLNFWATWCPPCIAEMPEIQALHASHQAAGDLVVLAVDVQEPPSVAGEFVNAKGLTMPVVSDRAGAVAKHYGVPGLPVTFFIDRDGVVRSKMLGPIIGKPLTDGVAAAGGR